MADPKFRSEGCWIMHYNTPLFMINAMPVERLQTDALAGRIAEMMNGADIDVSQYRKPYKTIGK